MKHIEEDYSQVPFRVIMLSLFCFYGPHIGIRTQLDGLP